MIRTLGIVVAFAACSGAGHATDRSTAAGSHLPPLEKPPAGDPGAFGHTYLTQVAERVRPPWHQFLEDCRLRLPPDDRLNQMHLVATLDATIDGAGALTNLAIVEASGVSDFDQVALDVMRDIAPYPVPAKDLRSDDDLLHVRWLFARDRRQAGVATALMRVVLWPDERAVPALVARGDLTSAASRLAGTIATTNGPATLPEIDLARLIFATAAAAGVPPGKMKDFSGCSTAFNWSISFSSRLT